MNEGIIILILSIVVMVLEGIICYQQFAFRKGIKAQLLQISQELAGAVDSDSEEKVMVFTDSRAMQELCAQINRLLDRHQRMLADYRRSEISSKKMLSNISHDIKTPLTVILGYLEIIRLNGGEQRELIDKVEARAKAVSDLVEQFFTLAKLEAGDMEIALSKLELCELCREVVLDFYEILSGKDYEVEVEIPEKTVYVQGNGDAIRRILNNLISNSLRYGSEGRYLGIFLHEDEKQVYIDVTDRGRGIEKDFAEHIFDRLFTMEDSRNRDIQGNGLGLTIARSLARQMGGDVTLVSRPWQKTPMGIAQIGKAFRNEITPGNFIFRIREFEQMELEFFCKPGTDLQWHKYWKEFCKNWSRVMKNLAVKIVVRKGAEKNAIHHKNKRPY